MSPLGGLMKIALGGMLAWAFISGALSRFVDQATSSLGGGASSPASPSASITGGTSA